MKKTIVALVLAASAPSAHAWGNLGLPDPVTWVAHAVAGFGVAWFIDTHTDWKPIAGVGAATGIGILKEISDVNFNVPDALSWGAGAALYYYQKDMVRCPDVVSELHQEDWYVIRKEKLIADCPKG
jgi:hypothetical protein